MKQQLKIRNTECHKESGTDARDRKETVAH